MEAPVATLVVAGVLLLASTVQISATTVAPTAAALPTSVSTTTPTSTSTRPSATGLEFCDVSQPVHLTAGSPRSSTKLRLSPPTPPRPCRLEVTAPTSNDLRLELLPVVTDATEAADVTDAASDAADTRLETPDDDDDAFDSHRLDFPLPSVIANPGMQAVSLVHQDAERRGSTANASCTLALYVQGEVVWSVNLCDARAVADANHPDAVLAKMPSSLSLVWTPPRPHQSVRASVLSITAVRKEVPAENLCSVRTLKLAGRGLESAMALELVDRRAAEDRAEPCRVTVEAPTTYFLSLLLVKSTAAEAVAASTSSFPSFFSAPSISVEADDDLLDDAENAENADAEDADPIQSRPACNLTVILGCSSQLYTVDLCNPDAAAALNSTELLPNNVTLVWAPPPAPQSGSLAATLFATTVIVTAVGRGSTCLSSQFTPCLRRARFPLCVSRELACDGHQNCPLLGEDEDPNMCHPRLIESPGQERTQRVIPADAKDILYELLSTHRRQFYSPNGSRSETPLQPEPSPDTLSNYGPWGYLMLGMLVCGAFLMLCGLWECCCRQPKPAPAAPSHTPTTVLMPQVGATGGVLVLDSDLEDDPQRPPAYDDLDQPPAYVALFPPGQPKLDDPVVGGGAGAPPPPAEVVLALEGQQAPTSLMADAPFPAADADDVPSLHSSPSSSSVSSTSVLAPS